MLAEVKEKAMAASKLAQINFDFVTQRNDLAGSDVLVHLLDCSKTHRAGLQRRTASALMARYRDRVVIGIACVDDHRQFGLARRRDMRPEIGLLLRLGRMFVIIVQSGFADGDHFGMSAKLFYPS